MQYKSQKCALGTDRKSSKRSPLFLVWGAEGGPYRTEKSSRNTVSLFSSGPAPGKPHSQSWNPVVEEVATALTGQAPKTNREILLDQKRGWSGDPCWLFSFLSPRSRPNYGKQHSKLREHTFDFLVRMAGKGGKGPWSWRMWGWGCGLTMICTQTSPYRAWPRLGMQNYGGRLLPRSQTRPWIVHPWSRSKELCKSVENWRETSVKWWRNWSSLCKEKMNLDLFLILYT